MKKKGITRWLQLLNPKNLAKEVHVYGYYFSWKAHLAALIVTLAGMSFVGMLFQLRPVYMSGILLVVGLMLPVFILDMYKGMFEQKRFSDVVTYGEQILYSFQKNGKIVSALKETKEVFEEGRMRCAIEEAIVYLEEGNCYSEKGILKEALEQIEQAYSCTKLSIIHELLISCEELGGNVENSILLVLNDIELWKRREYNLQAGKKVQNQDNVISIVVSVILCLVTLYVLDAMRFLLPVSMDAGLFDVEAIQMSSFLFVLFSLFAFYKSRKNLTKNWLQKEIIHKENYILSCYELVMDYSKRKRKSSKRFKGVAYHLAKKDVTHELYLTLPQWLMQIALLLQNNNVQVSLMKSMDSAPPVLRKELEQLRERLEVRPNELKTYTEFCEEFNVPEVQSCMKMLHAISESGTGNTQIQINNLLEQVHEMQNMAEDIRSKNEAFQMKLLFSYPVLAATFKLLMDMTIGMIYIFQLLSMVGGM